MNHAPRHVLLVLALLSGCAHEAGKAAASGAAESIKEPQTAQASNAVSAEVIDGLTRELAKPEQRERLAAIASSVSSGMVSGAVGETAQPGRGVGGSGGAPAPPGAGGPTEAMARQLGAGIAEAFADRMRTQLSGGTGPLAQELSAAAGRVSGAMVRGATDEVAAGFPECQGADRQRCIQQASAAGIGKGLLAALGPLPAIAAIGIALLGLALLAWMVWLSLSVRSLRRAADRP
ncbi:MAG: hypothetical protein QM765_20005 [Myxococcales bacterium]